MIDLAILRDAARRIAPHLVETPLRRALVKRYGALDVVYKCEQLQVTGSFKARGALNRMLSLDAHHQHVVAASTGNHGVACAYAAQVSGHRLSVYMPGGTDASRQHRIQALGATVRLVGKDCVDAEIAARQEMKAGRGVYISPYNDLSVVTGQGTLGLEVVRQYPDVTHVYIAVGGGGLISGMASAIKQLNPSVTIVGCSPSNSNVMHASVAAGRILAWDGETTLSKSTAGGVEPGAITFSLCATLVDEWVDVTEAEIQSAMDGLLRDELLYVEGAAAVADAALHKHAAGLPPTAKPLVILCGANR